MEVFEVLVQAFRVGKKFNLRNCRKMVEAMVQHDTLRWQPHAAAKLLVPGPTALQPAAARQLLDAASNRRSATANGVDAAAADDVARNAGAEEQPPPFTEALVEALVVIMQVGALL